jgi:hypothetical protein
VIWKDPEPDLYLWLTDPDADLGGPKTHGSSDSDPLQWFPPTVCTRIRRIAGGGGRRTCELGVEEGRGHHLYPTLCFTMMFPLPLCVGVPDVPAAAISEGSVADPNPDPDPPDPHVFGPPRSSQVWIRILLWIRIRILLSSCKNSKKNLDFCYFVTLFDFSSLKNDVNVASKSNKQKKFC